MLAPAPPSRSFQRGRRLGRIAARAAARAAPAWVAPWVRPCDPRPSSWRALPGWARALLIVALVVATWPLAGVLLTWVLILVAALAGALTGTDAPTTPPPG
jgi:hypothetical protein